MFSTSVHTRETNIVELRMTSISTYGTELSISSDGITSVVDFVGDGAGYYVLQSGWGNQEYNIGRRNISSKLICQKALNKYKKTD